MITLYHSYPQQAILCIYVSVYIIHTMNHSVRVDWTDETRLVDILMSKHEIPLEDHLKNAISSGVVTDHYVPTPQRRTKESLKNFARRLALYSSSPHFARVIFNRESHYVAFDVSGPLLTSIGKFTLVPAQVVNGRWGLHHLLFYPDLETVLKRRNIFVRLDSGCTSGQLFGDITCDCREQLAMSMGLCVKEGAGIIIHMSQHDGRGWGEYKMANQQLMDDYNLDTVAAAKLFYGSLEDVDQRTYTEAVTILKAFGFGNEHIFRIGTNNPRKVGAFTSFGMQLKTFEPIITKNRNHVVERNLAAKVKHLRHMIPPLSKQIKKSSV